MKQIFHFILMGSVLAAMLSGCSGKTGIPEANKDVVDLRYRVENEYHLEAINAAPFTIVVKSSRPWTISSQHPDWCIIGQEEGEAVADTLVHKGQGESTTVKVQYYDNTDLDDRIDKIEIASDYYLGKTVTVYQKGIAYLNVPEADIEGGLMAEKAAGTLEVNIKSNQSWSAKILPEADGETDWLSISEGETGEQDGKVVIAIEENGGEKRYANVAVYDRHGEERAMIKITQDGVQLDPESFEIRVGYDQLSAYLNVVSNGSWTAEKQSASDDWYSIDNPTGHTGDGTLNLTLTANEGSTSLRKSAIVLRSIPLEEGDPVIEKTIELKQAYPIAPVRKVMDNEELGAWKSDKGIDPVYTAGVGTLFDSQSGDVYCRLNQGGMPFGTYTFRWSSIGATARVRHWFCYSKSAEMKVDIRPKSGYISFDFNAPDGDSSQKPSIASSYSTDLDFTKPMEITYKFDPAGAGYCHVTYLCNGVEMASFDTSASTMCTTTWGADINMYIGVAADGEPSSAVLEWYEYTASVDWEQ